MMLSPPRRVFPRRVLVHEPSEVTRISDREEPAAVGGLRQETVETIWSSVVRYYRVGLQPALSLCIRRRGRIILDRSIGHARGNEPGADGAEKEMATPDTLFNFFSGSKCVTAMMMHLLDERGTISLEQPVAHWIPEFARHGKGRITIRDVLTHRAGIAAAPSSEARVELLGQPEKMLALICDLHPESRPGRRLAYHAITGGFLLGEIVVRSTGSSIREMLRRELCQPLGFTNLNYGVSSDQLGRVAREASTGPLPSPRFPLARQLRRSIGLGLEEVVSLANHPEFLTGIVPSGNIIATAEEVSRFFELLLRKGTLRGHRIFSPETVHRAVAEQGPRDIDRIIMLPLRYGAGFMLGGNISFFGRNTRHSFGHLGFTNVLGWADPERDISVALMNNGKPFVTPELVLWLDIPATISRHIGRI